LRKSARICFNSGESFMMVKLLTVGALGAFVVAGPLQHVGVLPQTAMGDASKASIKAVFNLGTTEAFAACGGGAPRGNNGWGNGENPAPGNSLAHQPKFEDPNTGPTPSHSPASGGGNR
jgi:hypothetical protein